MQRRYDVLAYTPQLELTGEQPPRVGDDAERRFSARQLEVPFRGMRVVAVGPPIHEISDATVIVADAPGTIPMPRLQALIDALEKPIR